MWLEKQESESKQMITKERNKWWWHSVTSHVTQSHTSTRCPWVSWGVGSRPILLNSSTWWTSWILPSPWGVLGPTSKVTLMKAVDKLVWANSQCWGVEGSLLWAYCSHSSLTLQSGVLRPGRMRGKVVETRREQVEMIGVNRGPGFWDWGHQRRGRILCWQNLRELLLPPTS